MTVYKADGDDGYVRLVVSHSHGFVLLVLKNEGLIGLSL